MQKPSTLDEFLQQASVDIATGGQMSAVELLAGARYRLHLAEKHIQHQNDLIQDYRDAASASMSQTLPRFETYAFENPATMEKALGVRWRMPEVQTLVKDWWFLRRRENVAALIQETSRRWGYVLARSLAKAVMPDSERELSRTLGAEERGTPQVNLETTR